MDVELSERNIDVTKNLSRKEFKEMVLTAKRKRDKMLKEHDV